VKITSYNLHCSAPFSEPWSFTAAKFTRIEEPTTSSNQSYQFSLVGFVVMPDHIHLLISEPAKATPSTVIQVLKQRVSRRLRRKQRKPVAQFNLSFANSEDSLPRFWQRRFYDFNVWSLKKRVEKLHYMHMNPLKRKLADHPKDWPWSSFSFYSKLKTGLIRIDPVN
jgi:putative transposase